MYSWCNLSLCKSFFSLYLCVLFCVFAYEVVCMGVCRVVRYLEEYVGGSYAGRIVGRCSVVVEICVLLITATEISMLRHTRGPGCGWYPLSLGVGLFQQTRGPGCGWYPLPFTATFLLRQAHITSAPRDTLPYINMMRQLNQPVHHITCPKFTSLRPFPPPSYST